MPSQVTAVDEIVWHSDETEKCSSPTVVVSSFDVPSAFSVNVPLTWRDPVTDGDGHLEPTLLRSSCPVSVKQEEETFQVPITSPPQSMSAEQVPDPPVPPLPLPPMMAPVPVPMLPPVPEGELPLGLQAAMTETIATVKKAEQSFIEETPSEPAIEAI